MRRPCLDHQDIPRNQVVAVSSADAFAASLARRGCLAINYGAPRDHCRGALHHVHDVSVLGVALYLASLCAVTGQNLVSAIVQLRTSLGKSRSDLVVVNKNHSR